ncbi:MAG: CBS domain-containing protein [Verrucomicrobiaceae bacterium]|nr:MAG: CBS domain-containing protein [Verrucomicrobiaceae bacterium]
MRPASLPKPASRPPCSPRRSRRSRIPTTAPPSPCGREPARTRSLASLTQASPLVRATRPGLHQPSTSLPRSSMRTVGCSEVDEWARLASGTSGGTVAPVMTIGGAVGGLVVIGLHHLDGFAGVPTGVAVLVGMVAVFAGTSRAFLTSVAFGLEATHATAAAGPLLIGCAVAVLVSKVCMHESMMTEKLARSGVKVPMDYEPDLLHGMSVSEAMLPDPKTVPPGMKVSALARRISGSDPVWGSVRLFPIVNGDRELLGIISRADVLAAVNEAPDSSVLEAGVVSPVTIRPHASLSEAADRMILHAVGRLPVVDDAQPPRLCGLLTRRGVLQARQHRIDAEKR